MSAYIIPLGLAFLGLILAFVTYRNIRRGGARFYTLEREHMLRRAMLTLAGTVFFFMLAIGYLIYTDQPVTTTETPAEGEVVEGEEGETAVTPTPESLELETFPPTPTVTATPDVNIPTATPTPIICRAVVEGTSGNGLTLRDVAGGAEMIDSMAVPAGATTVSSPHIHALSRGCPLDPHSTRPGAALDGRRPRPPCRRSRCRARRTGRRAAPRQTGRRCRRGCRPGRRAPSSRH